MQNPGNVFMRKSNHFDDVMAHVSGAMTILKEDTDVAIVPFDALISY